jgi:hypothetical protein
VREDLRYYEMGFKNLDATLPDGFQMPENLYVAIDKNIKKKIKAHEKMMRDLRLR